MSRVLACLLAWSPCGQHLAWGQQSGDEDALWRWGLSHGADVSRVVASHGEDGRRGLFRRATGAPPGSDAEARVAAWEAERRTEEGGEVVFSLPVSLLWSASRAAAALESRLDSVDADHVRLGDLEVRQSTHVLALGVAEERLRPKGSSDWET